MLDAEKMKAAQDHLKKLWSSIESKKNCPTADTNTLSRPNAQPTEPRVAVVNDELQVRPG